ncbi:SIS domain-containing protein [Mesobacillus foraminis]|uniref:SIS domain-containing protein n=1 Tax=Mesobacillus foraminis TaxID=279826 RepID=UPI001BE86AA4|nr:SIS domain-containing protein [Mesobacillus foraminis]MBT2758700.1 SIS domain-containing protein [Mesobacillus foraminis]
MIHSYFHQLKELLDIVEEKEKTAIGEASLKISDCIQSGGIIHVFGCGHSHLLGEELFYRAGGLVPVSPLFVEDLMLHKGALRSSRLEQENNYADSFMKDADIRPEDVVIVASNSGRNPVPIDAALLAKEKGAFVIGVTSLDCVGKQSSRHKDGLFLYEAVDLAINNHIPAGDALMTDERVDVSFGPGSTIIGVSIVNAIMAETVKLLADRRIDPPIFKSGNMDGAEEHNRRLIQKYQNRIPLLGSDPL